MNKNIIPIGLAALAALLIFGGDSVPSRLPLGSRSPTATEAVEPSTALKVRVKGVEDALRDAEPADKARYRSLWLAAADCTEQATEQITTTRSVLEFSNISGRIQFSGAAVTGKYPGLSDALVEVMNDAIGDVNSTLDADLRREVVGTFRALAWAAK